MTNSLHLDTASTSSRDDVSQQSSSQGPPIKTKLSRISTPKVRTGCITCKKRHVKCDETKPHCRKCLTFSGHCEGYAPLKVPKRRGRVVSIARTASPLTQTLLDPDLLDFHNATGLRYFNEFVSLAKAPWNAAVSSGGLWSVTLPQLARVNGTLRNAAMAIGALSTWHRASHMKKLDAAAEKSSPPQDGAADLHATAYLCHALKLQSRSASLQDTVFLSVMLLYFEILRGNFKAALDHVNHGLALLVTLLTSQDADRHISSLAPKPGPLLGAVADIFVALAVQARNVLTGRVGSCRPLPHFAKGLRDTSHSMESFLDLLSQLPRPTASFADVPHVFATLDEFEHHWTSLRRSQSAVGPVMHELVLSSGVIGSSDETVINDFYSQLLSHPRILAFYEESRQKMRVLDAAFLPLFRKAMLQPHDSPDYLRALHLRLQYLGVYAFENAPQYLQFESVQVLTPLFREYLSTASAALRAARLTNDNPVYGASLQCGLSMRFVLTAFFCRDPLVRDEAVAMLEGYPGQDGLWNTRALYVLAARNTHVERANAVEGTEDEQWQRLWRREYAFEEGGDEVVFRYLERDEETGTWGMVEEGAVVPAAGEARWVRRPLRSGRLMMEDLMVAA